MAMHKDQEGDANANHVSHPNPNQDQAGQSSTDHITIPNLPPHSPAPSDTASTAPFCTLLQATFSALSQTASLGQGQVAGESSSAPSRRRPRLSVSAAVNGSTSSALCDHEFCQAASSAVESGSSSPDVNYNTLTSCVKTSGPWCLLDGDPRHPVVLDLDAVEKTHTEGWIPDRNPPLPVLNMASDGRNKDNVLHTSVEKVTNAEHCVSEPTGTNSGSAFEAAFRESMVKEDTSPNKNTGRVYRSFIGNTDVQVCDLRSEHEQNESDSSMIPVGNDKNSKYVGFGLSAYRQGQHTLQADWNLRNSVDMDVEDSESDEGEPPRPCESKSFTPYIPQTTGDFGLAGRDLLPASTDVLSDTFDHRPSLRITPVSVVEESSALSLSHCLSSDEGTSIEVSPPIWTNLALRSATRSSTLPATSDMERHTPATANAHTQCISDSIFSEETGAVVETVAPNILLSPKLVKSDSLSKRVPRAGHRHHSISTASRTCSSPSKRCPLHGTLRQRQGRRHSSAVKNPDVFLEALLEDECALYAGRLQSFFKDLKTVCDRQESPDPVAKTLTEGDDMHFIPICDESILGYRPAFKDSTFIACLPV